MNLGQLIRELQRVEMIEGSEARVEVHDETYTRRMPINRIKVKPVDGRITVCLINTLPS